MPSNKKIATAANAMKQNNATANVMITKKNAATTNAMSKKHMFTCAFNNEHYTLGGYMKVCKSRNVNQQMIKSEESNLYSNLEMV